MKITQLKQKGETVVICLNETANLLDETSKIIGKELPPIAVQGIEVSAESCRIQAAKLREDLDNLMSRI